MKPDNTDGLILQTIDDFARSVGVTVETVRIWIRKNKIPSVKIGKRRLVNIHKIKNTLESEE
ncbi:MAG: helix-turn-helix domain-containing protein [Endozoicomonas sp.]|uniref:helix-turn-helix domain-containing protein n=1 Tax=Endozoicomonas sp. TaxID=1892382 RepID=UPI003D9BC512